MPHVDEGTLHALLDGALGAEDPDRARAVEAHLETCADCRALRDEAARIRSAAADILGALEPDVRPDFAEVLVRAGVGAGAGFTARPEDTGTPDADGSATYADARVTHLRRQARTTRGLAWAATIVLALGTGYLIRDRLVPERAATAPWADRPSPEAMAPPSATPASPASAAGPGVDGERRAGAEEAAPRGGRGDEAAPAVGQAAAAATAVQEGAAPPARDSEPVVTGEVDPPAILGHEAPIVAGPRRAQEQGRPTPTPVLEQPAVAEPRAFRPRPGAAPERALVDRTVAHPVTPDALEAREPLTLVQAREVLDGPVYVLPGAEIVDIRRGETASGAEVRSYQRLADGVEVLVTQRPVDAEEGGLAGVAAEKAVASPEADSPARPEPAAALRAPAMLRAAAPPQPENSASVLHDGQWVTVTGSLPAETLQALAAAATPVADD